MHKVILCGFMLALSLLFVSATLACNKNVCASLVSKCLLLKSCECDMTDKKNCTCCRQCHKCLARLYTECCSCVGMCPDHHDDSLLKSSTVEELRDPMPELFEVLTEEEDLYLRWVTFNYPAHLDLLYFKPRDQGDFGLDVGSNLPPDINEELLVRHGGHHIALDPNSKVMNCTVAYMTPCMSLGKCRTSCQSMGAARYRWFHEHGCCECIGSTCLDFGKGEPHCLKCPESQEDYEADDYYYSEDYDEHDGPAYLYSDEDEEEDELEEEYEYEEDATDATEDEDVVEEEEELDNYLHGYKAAGVSVANDVEGVRKVSGLN